jgi:hypothetical protein
MKHERTNRFDRLLQIRAPEFLTDAQDAVADQRLTSRSDYIRVALLDRLKADGVDVQHLPEGWLSAAPNRRFTIDPIRGTSTDAKS